MKKLSLLFQSILIVNLGIFAGSQKSPHTFLFCLKPELQPLQISLSRGKLNVGMEELDDFIHFHDIILIEPWIKSAMETDRDGDIYLNRIYRVYIDSGRNIDIEQIISSIQDLPFILNAEPEYLRKPYYTPNDPSYNSQCSIGAVKADLAWDYWNIPDEMPGDDNILLASVDTGVDYTHPDLIENIWVNQGELVGNEIIDEIFIFIDNDGNGIISALEISNFMATQNDLNGDGVSNFRDVFVSGSPFIDNIDNDGNGEVDDLIGWDVVGSSGTPDPDPFPKKGIQNSGLWSHGTHVAGILAAVTNNGIGMASSSFNGKIMSVKCSMDDFDTEDPPIKNGFNGIFYAARAGNHAGMRTIINCSWGGNGYVDNEQAVINSAYNDYGAIIVAAAGNGDENATGKKEEYAAHYPASYENVISVCAVSCSGNWGDWATYHTTVDIAAPGDNVYSTIIGGGFKVWDGSSMASPNASSVMGLLWSYYPEWTNGEIITQVQLSSDPFIYEKNPDYIDCKGEKSDGYCLGAGMVDARKAIGRGFSPNIETGTYIFTEIIGDGDGLINPGETGYLEILFTNVLGWADAENIEAVITSNNPDVTIDDGNAVYGDIVAGDSLYNLNDERYKVAFSSDIILGDIDFRLEVTGSSIEYDYKQLFEYTNISVSMNQVGFPVSTVQLRSSPLVIDLDGDGDDELIIGDNNGFVHIYYADGIELKDDTFPFDTGDQIWGSAAAADMDGDGLIDFVITSKSKHLYIFDINGLKTDYNANKYLMATPAIGNLDDDEYLEVVVGSYSTPASSQKLFVVNHDGTDVDGFPLLLGEKVKAGVALADFNDNGKDDIVLGTDDNHIHLIYDNGSKGPGFPYQVGDKIQTAPSILNVDGEKVIFAGCLDNNLYAINSDGSLRFIVETNNKIETSPSFLFKNDNQYIFIGANDSLIYAVDTNGNALNGWPVNAGAPISKSIIFSDLDCDGGAEIIGANEKSYIVVYNEDGTFHTGFPIIGSSAFTGSPIVVDLDNDFDLEIISGAANHLTGIDIKSFGSDTSYWNMYRGNLRRTGYSGTAQIGGYIANCPEQLSNTKPYMPNVYQLKPLHPNPFNTTTVISYIIPNAGHVMIEAYDIRGRFVNKILSNFQTAGYHSVRWNASAYPSGIYFITMKVGSLRETRKVLFIK